MCLESVISAGLLEIFAPVALELQLMAEELKPVAMAQHSCALERMHFISGYSPLLFHHGAQGKGMRYMQVPIHPASQGSCSSQNPAVQHSSQVRCYCFCLSNALYNTTGDTLRNH